MSIWKKILLLAALPLALAACASENPVHVDLLQPGLAESASISMVQQPPAEGHLVARLNIQGAPGQTRTQLIAALVQKATKLGASQLYIVHEKSTSAQSGNPLQFNPAGGAYQPSEPLHSWNIQADAFVTQHK